MKRISLFLILMLFVAVLFLTGCAPTVPDIDVVVEITGFKQEASCGITKTGITKTFEVLNGDKCPPPCASCCPPCDCDSCCDCEECEECEQCEQCEECEQCQECQECEECEQCQECEECEQCQECPTCPACPSCPCYSLKWGDLEVDFEAYGDDVTLKNVCFTIKFQDDTEIDKCVGIDEFLPSGTTKEYSVGIVLNPAKRVVLVVVKSYGSY